MAKGKSEDREKRPRRTKAEIDPMILQRIVDIVSVGASKQDACNVVGISFVTLRKWELMGEDGKEPFAQFALDMKAAKARKKTYLIELLHKAAEDDWKAGGWLLERQYPAEYSKRVEVAAEVTEKKGPDLTRLTTKQLCHLREIQKALQED